MTEILPHTVHFTVLDDGSHLAASVTRPWFAVSAATLDAAREKAQAALDFHARHTPTVRPARKAHSITSFAPTHAESLRPATLSA